jgi:DNA-binding NarL/FixJ family response regulator
MDKTNEREPLGSSPTGSPATARGSGANSTELHSIRVVIVDDHALVREGTRQLLEQNPDIDVVGTAGSGEEALTLLHELKPDVALVDINLPAMSGLELAREMATALPGVHVLILSAYDEYAYIAEALEIGVGGYLLKTASAKELVDAVRAVSDGVLVLDRQVSKRLVRHRQSGPETILVLLAQGKSNKQIAAQLELGTRTVEGYVSNVLSKLGVTSRTEAVTHALSHRLVNAPNYVGVNYEH